MVRNVQNLKQPQRGNLERGKNTMGKKLKKSKKLESTKALNPPKKL
jgi:hypothetical protein